MSRDFSAIDAVLRNLSRTQELMSPSIRFQEIVEELTRHHQLLSPAMQIQDMIEKLRPTLGLTDMISPLLRHNFQQQMISDVFDKLDATHAFADLIGQRTSALSAVIAKIENQQRSFADLLKPHLDFKLDLPMQIAAMVDASSVWRSSIDSIVSRFNHIGLIGTRDDLVDRLLSPSRAYAAFVESATARLNDALSPTNLIAANSAFKMIESQYSTIASALAVLPSPVDLLAPFEERVLAAPMVQFEASLELDLSEEEREEPQQQLILIPATRCAEDARVLVGLVCRANEITSSAGKGEFFKPTTRFVEACADIAWIIADDKKTFGDLIDCLYFIFYEGAGKDNLRFLDKNGGPLKAEEADFIWCLKHLRNKYSRHDPDHGKAADIARSWADLQQKWLSLGLNFAPYRTEEFLAAQQALVRMAREFMESVLSRLTGREVQ